VLAAGGHVLIHCINGKHRSSVMHNAVQSMRAVLWRGLVMFFSRGAECDPDRFQYGGSQQCTGRES
jgi:hypothetical protein